MSLLCGTLDRAGRPPGKYEGHDPEATASYIRHHLEAADRTADLFTDDAVTQVHRADRLSIPDPMAGMIPARQRQAAPNLDVTNANVRSIARNRLSSAPPAN
jgi:hypothetical protein